MSFDINSLSGLSARELKAVIRSATKQHELASKRPALGTVRAQINKILRESGYSIDELYGEGAPVPAKRGRKPGTKVAKKAVATKKAAKKSKKTGTVPPKYRDPANAENQWTGRGKPPRWMAAYLDKGKKKEDFLI